MCNMPDNNRNSKLVAKNSLFLFIRMLLVTVVGLYTSRVILDVLGVSDFGIYNVVGGIVVFFTFLQQALNNATYRFFTYALGESDMEKLRRTFSMSLNLHFLLALIVFVFSELIGVWLLNNYLVIPPERLFAANVVYQLSICSLCVNIIKTPYNSSIIAHEKMSFFAYTSILEVILKLVIVLLLYHISFDKLSAYAVLIFVVDVFLCGLYYLYCKKLFSECTYFKFWDRAMLVNMFKYSGWSIIVNMADVSVTQSVVVFFNVFFGVVTNAALGVANQVTSKVCLFLNSFTQAFNPQIIKAYARNDTHYFFNLIYSTSKLSYYLLLLVCLPLLLNIDFILTVWLVEVPQDTSTLIFYTILYALVDAYSAPLWISVHATGNLKTHQLLMSSIKIINIPLAYLMLKFGLGAWTVLALKAFLNFVCSIARTIYMKRLISLSLIQYCTSVFLPISFVTVLSVPVPFFVASMQEDGWIKLLLSTAVSLLFICFFVFYIGLNKRERELLVSMVPVKRFSIFRS